ncbi:MAG TPA: hypothetical protein VG015_04165 [Candidatus Dormibacteraeota bacterium]|jgi:hypothetical protein|nr:hypothetical protein [Candidatus Dormibacteraeota bacterium]
MSWKKAAPLSGFLFIVLFVAGVVVSQVPADTASDQDWIAAYTGSALQLSHLATGICLVLAGLSLMSFLTALRNRIDALRGPAQLSSLPLVAAATSAACIAAGGIMMATVSGAELVGHGPLPGADLLRFANAAGFGLVALGGMLAADLSLVGLAIQARATGLFGPKLFAFSLVVAVMLLGSLLFLPILGLFVWLMVVAVKLLRTPQP